MEKVDVKTIFEKFLIYLFFLNGFIYLFYPNEILNPNFWGKTIKYFLVITFLLQQKHFNVRSILAILIIYTSLLLLYFLARSGNFTITVNYLFPLLSLVIVPQIDWEKINFKRMLLVVWTIIIAIAFIEFIFFKGLFPIFADMGYRVCSIMINPNNLSIIMCLFSVWFLAEDDRSSINYLYLGITLIVVLLSGSRSGIIIHILMILICIINSMVNLLFGKYFSFSKVTIILSILFFLIIIGLFIIKANIASKLFDGSYGTRELTGISLKIGRLYQWESFFELIKKNFIFPWSTSYLYVDNQYLHMYGFFGFPALLVFIVFNVLLFIRCILARNNIGILIIICFFFIGMFENFLYLWPSSYIYWGFASRILTNRPNTVQNDFIM